MTTNNTTKRVESETEVELYLDKLVSVLNHENVKIKLQPISKSHRDRNERYTNRFTINLLFPDEDIPVVLKRELKSIRIEHYIETMIDREYPKKLEFRVFGKYYDDYVYIKMRINYEDTYENSPLVHIMSFHYALHPFTSVDFPYKRSR